MFAKGLFGYLPANLLQGLVGFLTLMVFTRILTPEDYGHYALAFGVSSLASTVVFTWLEAALARFYPQERLNDERAPALYGTVYRLFLLLAAGFALVTGLVMTIWPAVTSDAVRFKMAVGAGLGVMIFRSATRLVQEQRRSAGRVGPAAGLDMIQTTGGFVLGVGFGLMGLGGASALLGTGAIAMICLPVFAREDWGRALAGRYDPSRARTYAAYGLPISLSLILTLVLYTADRFLVAHYLGAANAGAYSAGYSLASRILDVLFIWFGAAGEPAMINALETGGLDSMKSTARALVRTMALIIFPAVGGLIAVTPALATLLIGPGLRDRAVEVAPLITLGAMFAGFNAYYFLKSFPLSHRTGLLIAAMVLPALANIGLNLVLIPIMGLKGSAVATLISFLIGIATAIVLGRRAIVMPLPWRDIFLTLFSTLVMMGAVMTLPGWHAHPAGAALELALKAVAGLGVYGALAWMLNLGGVRQIDVRTWLAQRRLSA